MFSLSYLFSFENPRGQNRAVYPTQNMLYNNEKIIQTVYFITGSSKTYNYGIWTPLSNNKRFSISKTVWVGFIGETLIIYYNKLFEENVLASRIPFDVILTCSVNLIKKVTLNLRHEGPWFYQFRGSWDHSHLGFNNVRILNDVPWQYFLSFPKKGFQFPFKIFNTLFSKYEKLQKITGVLKLLNLIKTISTVNAVGCPLQ